jgi:hypothetical protein
MGDIGSLVHYYYGLVVSFSKKNPKNKGWIYGPMAE